MKKLNAEQEKIVNQLASIDVTTIKSVNDFLESVYFKESLGRALILQNVDKYAVFFLKNESFDREQVREKEIQSFFELIRFLAYLNQEGYITIYGTDFQRICLVHDDFNAVKIEHSTIVLNSRGYYTDAPRYIYDKDKNIVYKGVLLKYQQYEQILNIVTGNLIVSEKLGVYSKKVLKYSAPKPVDVPKVYPEQKMVSNLKSYLLTSIAVLSCLLVVFFCFFVYTTVTPVGQEETNVWFKGSMFTGDQKKLLPVFKDLIPKMQEDSDVEKFYYGVDISHYNGTVVTKLTDMDSLSFIICKATEGTWFTDPYFSTNWDLIEPQRYLIGAYHFYRVDADPIRQADLYIKTLKAKGTPDIAPIVDIETASIPENGNYEPGNIQRDLLLFLNRVKEQTRRDPIIYTGSHFANKYLLNDSIGNYRLWLAQYVDHEPRVPKTWARKGYFIWQKSCRYEIDSHHTDFDQYYGSMDNLLK